MAEADLKKIKLRDAEVSVKCYSQALRTWHRDVTLDQIDETSDEDLKGYGFRVRDIKRLRELIASVRAEGLKEADQEVSRLEIAQYLTRLEMSLMRDDLDMKMDFSEEGPSSFAERVCPGFDALAYELSVQDQKKEKA